MGQVVAIHQPNFLPWIGYFQKLMNSDIFIFLDNVQFSKGSYTNRVQININGEPKWLTVPVSTTLGAAINLIEINQNEHGIKKQLKTIQTHYAKAPFFNKLYGMIECILLGQYGKLSEYNIQSIHSILNILEIEKKIILASKLNINENDPTQRLIKLVKSVGGTSYLHGKGGVNYQDSKAFDNAGIELKENKVKLDSYQQLSSGTFIPGLSIIDTLFNLGGNHTRTLINSR